MAGGRPSQYTEELVEEICQLLAEGVPMARISKRQGMPGYSTLLMWQATKPEFLERSARAKRDGTHYLADQALDIADDLEIDPSHKRIMIDTRLRLIGKWNAPQYGDKIEQVHSGSVEVSQITRRVVDPAAGE